MDAAVPTKTKSKTAPARKAERANLQQTDAMRVEYMSLEQLKRWPRNPKLHNVGGLQESFEKYGFVAPPVIDETSGRLVAGHGRIETLEKLKAAGALPPDRVRVEGDDWAVPVLRGVAFRDDDHARGYLLADNRLGETGWDTELLLEQLRALPVEHYGPAGFAPGEVERLLAQADSAPAPSPPEFVQFQAGGIKTNHECPRCKYKWSE